MTRTEITAAVHASLVELFEVEPARIVPGARFDEDLEVDSIDAVDLVEHLSRTFKKKVSLREFRSVRTVQDLVDAIERLQAQ